ncbi:hypothetical protein AQUCO_00100723v1 [Aquilegia coerulea]|uniref:ATP-dependent RNA helicase Ski2/MTR4 C-terminal domain-containing protein n=1 Tax=Aquilegia coerulea TaxID=218851 RepID=A0A2G5FBN8_AQUCA|nr:hypothetical protein AQUCO_00100723v1 [Aquilegia coerulea]
MDHIMGWALYVKIPTLGIGVHHSGLLPILKEGIEILFQEGLIKVGNNTLVPLIFDLIRAIRRLEEVLQQLILAAKSIGETELESKFEAVVSKIKRDIVFAATLYL